MPTAPPPSPDVAIETRVFWLRFRNEIVGAVIIVLAAIIGFAGYRLYLERREVRAAVSLANAKGAVDYRRVIETYPGTPAGSGAYLLLAQTQRAEKKFAEANTTLQDFVNKNPTHELVATAKMAMAANLESMDKTDEALALYQQIATSYSKNFNAPLALMCRVHILKAKGRTDEARQACDTILTQYRDSFWAREAMQESSLLKPKTAATPEPTLAVKGPTPPPLLRRPAEPKIQPKVVPASPAKEQKPR
jgi:TolA-binding protein